MERFNIYQEIHDQPEIWELIIKKFKKSEKNIINFLNKSDTYFFAGCGSGYNASVFSKNICEFLSEKNCFDYQASELFLFGKEIYNEGNKNKPITFLFSRSGNTTEVVNAVKHINECKLSYLFGITCYEDSYLFKKSGENNKINKFFILSNTPSFGFAREAKLKLLEMTLSWADSFNILDFRHGPKAVVDKNSLVVIFLSDSAVDYELSVAKEMKELGGNLLIFGDIVKKEFYDLTENIVDLEEGINEWIRG